MPTTYTDQFYVLDPGNPPPAGTTLTNGAYTFIDQNNNLRISSSGNDSFDGSDITAVWLNDTITVDVGGVTRTITGVTFYTADGRSVFTPTDGAVLSPATFVSSTFVNTSTQVRVGDLGPPCFLAGTLILTDRGLRPVEALSVGDRVVTRDRGLQTVRWTGHRRTPGTGDYAPILFDVGAIGNVRPLRVSPQHRMLLTGWQAELFYGEDEVLVAAKHLVDGRRVTVAPCDQADYHHILFDDHEIVEAEGCPSESFHPGDWIMMADAGVRAELLALFPDLNPSPGKGGRMTARRVLRRYETAVLHHDPDLGHADRRRAA